MNRQESFSVECPSSSCGVHNTLVPASQSRMTSLDSERARRMVATMPAASISSLDATFLLLDVLHQSVSKSKQWGKNDYLTTCLPGILPQALNTFAWCCGEEHVVGQLDNGHVSFLTAGVREAIRIRSFSHPPKSMLVAVFIESCSNARVKFRIASAKARNMPAKSPWNFDNN